MAQKLGPLSLIAHIFKTFEPVCIIFGSCQLCFIQNTSVKYVCFHQLYNAKLRHLAKVSNSIICLWKSVGGGALRFTAHIFKMPELIMAALHSRCGHYILVLFLLSSFFFFLRLISAVADWMSAILLHMVWPCCEFRMQVWSLMLDFHKVTPLLQIWWKYGY